MKNKNVEVHDLEQIFNETATEFLKEKLEGLNLSYCELNKVERDQLYLSILQTLKAPDIKKSGSHRLDDWVAGWGQNRDEFSETKQHESLIPKYFGKFPYVRWKQDFIKPNHKDFEYNMVKVLQYWVFEKFFSDVENIYEFGCGTGHNLLRAAEVNDQASITGLDWATSSQDTIAAINRRYHKSFGSHRFDFFNVDESFALDRNSGVFTFAALEQVGDAHQGFLEYLLEQKPQICVHIEPIGEMLEPEKSFVDYLSVEYFKKRNYLDGLVNSLKNMQTSGKIEIVYKQRSYIGSCFVDGYSIVAWRPTNA